MLSITRFQHLVRISMLIALTIAFVSTIPSKSVSLQATSAGTSLVSIAYNGDPAEGHSSTPSISADGRYIAFDSWASNLVQDGYQLRSVYIRDMQTETNEFVSVSTNNEQTSAANPTINADGRFVAFETPSSNLVPGDTNNRYDIFVRDRQDHQTERISVSSNEEQANDNAFSASISTDGRFIAFHSGASNLTSDDENYYSDVFVRDRQAGTTELVSVGSDGSQSNMTSRYPSISGDGRYVVFESDATNLVLNDTNGSYDIFVRDRQNLTTERVSVSSQGAQANNNSHFSSITVDGRYVVFESYANNLAPDDTNILRSDVFLHDRQTGTTELISRSLTGTSGNDWSSSASISNDGRWVAFASVASNLVPDDTNGLATDIFVHDRQSGQIERVSLSSSGTQANGTSGHPRIQADGSLVVFDSDANNLVDGDTNGVKDIFLHELESVPPEIDLSILDAVAVQSVEGVDLVKDKSTAVKVVISKTGAISLNNVSVSLHVGGIVYNHFYVSEQASSANHYKLFEDNTQMPLNFPAGPSIKTIYFFNPSDQISPVENSFDAIVILDSASVILESNEENNTREVHVPVRDTRWSGWIFPNLDIRYFRADTSALSNSSFYEYIRYSNDYLRASFPISKERFKPDVIENYNGDSISSCHWFGLPCDDLTLFVWTRDTLTLLRIAYPSVDRFVGVVPQDWFANNTLTGERRGFNMPLARGLVVTEALWPGGEPWLSDIPDGLALVPHEIGHSYGLEHRENDPQSASPGLFMTDLESYIIQPTDIRNIPRFMTARPENLESWIDTYDYQYLYENHTTAGEDFSLQSLSDQMSVLAVGMFAITDTVTLEDWYLLPEMDLTELPSGPYSFDYLDSSDNTIYSQSFGVDFILDYGVGVSETQTLQVPFVLTLPYISGISKIAIKNNGNTLAEKIVSMHAPTVNIISLSPDDILIDQVTIQWEGFDEDGDPLSYVILFSPDNGITWNPISIGIKTTNYQWNTRLLSPGSEYKIKVIATDGFNTGEDISDAPFTILGHIYLPITLIRSR